MLKIYPACFIKDKDGYSVFFPDWENTATCGRTFQEAMEMAVDCLAGLCYENKLSGIDDPKPSLESSLNINQIADIAECKVSDISIHTVSVDADVYAKQHFEKCVKKTVTIYEWQNREGIKRGINFSKIFQDALTKELLKEV